MTAWTGARGPIAAATTRSSWTTPNAKPSRVLGDAARARPLLPALTIPVLTASATVLRFKGKASTTRGGLPSTSARSSGADATTLLVARAAANSGA